MTGQSPTQASAGRAGHPIAERRDWRLGAACQSADPDLFFPISSSGRSLEQATAAKAVCSRCQVRAECLAFAVRTRQIHGVWGGLAPEERYQGALAGEPQPGRAGT